jgi:hypothetical protein
MTRIDDILQGYIEAARSELKRSGMADIQRQTALVWYGRAVAAIELARPEDAREFAHESIEHAALAGDMSLVVELHRRLAAIGLLP